jgi:hypothetical protein
VTRRKIHNRRRLRAALHPPENDGTMAVMADAVSSFRAASEANNIDALMETLAADAKLLSPISGRMVFRGRRDLRILFTAIYGSLGQLRWREEIGDDSARVVVGEARVFGVPLHDAMVLDLTVDGQIERIRPHIRPWLALTLLFFRVIPMIAGHPRVVWRALRDEG